MLDVFADVGGDGKVANDVLHMVSLALDQAAQVHHNALGFVALTRERSAAVFHGGKILVVAFAFPLQLLGNFLLENQSFQGIVALLFGTRKAKSKASDIVFLLVDETGETAVLALVAFDLDFEFGSLLSELLSKCLEFEELQYMLVLRRSRMR